MITGPALVRMREELPAVAAEAVAAIIREVPSYSEALSGPMGQRIQDAVRLALGGFLNLAGAPDLNLAGAPGAEPHITIPGVAAPVLQGAYELGRGEARQGRSMDALLAAYRLGARVSWRHLSSVAVESGLDAEQLSRFAELVFAYIDELSAASASGHKDELDSSGRLKQRNLERLGRMLLDGHSPDALASAAEAAGWSPPETLSAVILPVSQVASALMGLEPTSGEGAAALRVVDDKDEGDGAPAVAVLLVPDASGPARSRIKGKLRGHQATIGPAVPWQRVRASHMRAQAVARLLRDGGGISGNPAHVPLEDPVDTEDHLRAIVLNSDRDALADLTSRTLAPLEGLRDSTASALRETLRAWLLLQGRREAVAEHLHVHPQTVRYRMGRIREMFGARLDDPEDVLDILISLERT